MLLAQLRKRGRCEEMVFDALDDSLFRLACRALCDPLLIRLKGIPFGFAFSEAFPLQQVRQRVIARPDQRRSEANLFDAVFFEKAQRRIRKALLQRRQPAWCAVINPHFDDHVFNPVK